MSKAQPQLYHSPHPGAPIHYEQPLNERMRTLLRLEFLFEQAKHHSARESTWGSRAAVGSLLEILAILNRGDVRSEILKELEKHATHLSQYQFRPGVDSQRLGSLLDTIASLRDRLNASGNHMAQVLKESEFLNSIKHRSAIPGGTCEFDLPDYNHWLSQNHDQRLKDLEHWFQILKPVSDSVNELLWLTRESAQPVEQTAIAGMYQKNLDKEGTWRLIRVTLAPNTEVFPEISGGSHRFTIRFLHWTEIAERPYQTDKDQVFWLTCC